MQYIIFNPLFWIICAIALLFFKIYIKRKARQKDIQKGIEKALKEMDKRK